MASHEVTPNFRSFTVGWIAALHHELAAALFMLDHRYSDQPLDFRQHIHDKNSYCWGRVGKHYVTIATLPAGEYGTTSALETASGLLYSIPHIRIGLLVGIGAGIPYSIGANGKEFLDNEKDIRLGDVVVSQPDGTSGGVVQYDLGKASAGVGIVERKGVLASPPRALLTALAKLKAVHDFEERKIDGYVKSFEKNRHMNGRYNYPGLSKDPLFGNIDTAPERGGEEHDKRDVPTIHYGIIASGNTLIKSKDERARILRLLEKDNVNPLCFEMEAAGLMDSFPCLVIRGISDYADERKDEVWQRHAAAVAAAFAKDFLGCVNVADVVITPEIGDLMKDIKEDMEITRSTIQRIHEDLCQAKLHAWLSPPDPWTNHSSARARHEKHTGLWLLDNHAYQRWKRGFTKHVWIQGMAGCGKTILCSTIIEDMKLHCKAISNAGLAVFYFSFSDRKKQTHTNLMRSLVAQLARKGPGVSMLHQAYEKSNKTLGVAELEQILIASIKAYEIVYILLDALDECPEHNEIQHVMLEGLERLAAELPNLKILATSREQPGIRGSMQNLGVEQIAVDTRAVDADIQKYVSMEISRDRRLTGLSSELKTTIETTISQNSNGMFRWAYCQLLELKKLKSSRPTFVQKALLDLPPTLDATYARMLTDIDTKYQGDALKLLRWIAYSQYPMTLRELVDAVLIDFNIDSIDFDDRGDVGDALSILSGLITTLNTSGDKPESDPSSDDHDHSISNIKISADTQVRLAHFSVKEYLQSSRILGSDANAFHLVPAREHRVLTQSCLLYLAQCSRSIQQYEVHEPEREREQVFKTFPLLGYAVHSWYQHARLQNHGDFTRELSLFASEDLMHDWRRLHDAVDPEYFEEDMVSELYWASFLGLEMIVQKLIEQGADVSLQGGYHGNPLQAASALGHENVVSLLIKRGAHVNALSTSDGPSSALGAACAGGHERVVAILLDKGHDPNLRIDEDDESPLKEAAEAGSENIVKMLIKHGADVNMQGGLYGNALQAALWSRRTIVAIVLINRKADVNSQGGVFGNALQAASIGGDAGLVQIILAMGANVNAQGGRFGNALQAASTAGREVIVAMLLECGADPHAQGGEYGNAIQAASARGHEAIVAMLLKCRVDVNARGGQYDSALQAARKHKHTRVEEMLIAHGAVDAH